MTCDDTRRRLTAYLDGELDADGGTRVRVHLRGCEACREVASDEAVLRDGLRALPTIDPPASLWAGVQARLAAAEEIEARRPWWRRTLARWAPSMPQLRHVAAGGMLAAAVVTLVVWRTRPAEEPQLSVIDGPSPVLRAAPPAPAPPAPAAVLTSPQVAAAGCEGAPPAGDVSADLALDAGRVTGCYAAAIDDLLGRVRALDWASDRRAALEAQVATMRSAIDGAADGRPRQRAQRAMVRYLQNALARDEVVAIAAGGGLP